MHQGGRRSPPLGSGSWTWLHKATAALTSFWEETCHMPGEETFRRPCWFLCWCVSFNLTCHPGLSCSPWPFCAGESRSCVHIEVHQGLPRVFTSTTPGTFPAPVTSKLSCFKLLITGLNWGCELETPPRGSTTTSTAGGLKPVR